jgi:hypothetical protein
MTFFSILTVFNESYSSQSACFSNVASATFIGNAVDTPFWPGSRERISQGVLI